MSRDGRERARAAQQAAEWLRRLPTAGASEKSEFIAWLKASPLHVRAALLAMHCDDLLRELHRERAADVEELVRYAQEIVRGYVYPEIEAMMQKPAADRPPQHVDPPGSAWRLMSRWTWAAIVSSVTIATALVLMLASAPPDKVVRTEASEWRTVELSDGSVVRVGPHTELVIAFEDHRRLVQLDGGEALFEVAKDSSRPFIVDSDLAVVRAVGTRFGVSFHTKTDGIVIRGCQKFCV